METACGKLLASSNNSPQKAFSKSLKFTVFAVILGIILAILGNFLLDELSYWSKDYEEILAILTLVMGILLIMLGIVYPFLIKAIVGKCRINVYEDHIEGTAFNVVANTQALVDFYEKYDKISSVSTAKNTVSINLTSGNSIRCTAFNAEEVANTIRKQIT